MLTFYSARLIMSVTISLQSSAPQFAWNSGVFIVYTSTPIVLSFLYYARGYTSLKLTEKKSGLLREKRRNNLIVSMEKHAAFIWQGSTLLSLGPSLHVASGYSFVFIFKRERKYSFIANLSFLIKGKSWLLLFNASCDDKRKLVIMITVSPPCHKNTRENKNYN